ncbi:uncharacterized protein LOC143268901 isoform X2 [Peromyscus maniculatus bairdii]|uniref:uncharacterized protein LOC143268901 isoform X2 n=1 Tax=Peromyscus maniculatus bairdii TaxID=230844 RepID=UPI003FD4529F
MTEMKREALEPATYLESGHLNRCARAPEGTEFTPVGVSFRKNCETCLDAVWDNDSVLPGYAVWKAEVTSPLLWVKIRASSLLENVKGAMLEEETRLTRHKTCCHFDSPDPRTTSQSSHILSKLPDLWFCLVAAQNR